VEGGQVSIQSSSHWDDVERAQLPLLSSSSTPRSSLAGDSSHNSPMKSDFEGGVSKSPPQGSFADVLSSQKLSTSPRDKTLLNEGASRYLANVKASRLPAMPPEPTSPPPSPPTKARQLEKDGKAPTKEIQPKLPPKKRSQKTTQFVQPGHLSADFDVYSFDRLDSSTGSPQTGNFQPPARSLQPQMPSPTPDVSYDDSNVYEFDSLEIAPLPSRPPKPESYSMAKPCAPPQDVDDSCVYEFDRLDKPPVIPKKIGTGGGAKLKSSQSFNVQSSSSSLSSLKSTGKKSFHEAPPTILPRKPDPPTSPYQFHDDDNVYEFDSLDPETPKAPSQATPTLATSAKGAMDLTQNDSDIYEFDTLQAKEQPRINEGRGAAKDTLSPETGQVRKSNPIEAYSLVPSAKPAPKPPVDSQKTPQSPALPPRSSPLVMRSKPAEVRGI